MNIFLKTIKPILVIILMALMIWYFSEIFISIGIALVLSIIGRPLVNFYSKLKIKKHLIGNTLGSLLGLLSILTMVVLFFVFMVPLLISQANLVVNIDFNLIAVYYQDFLNDLSIFLLRYDIVEPGQNINSLIETELSDLLRLISFSALFSALLSTTSSLIMGVFIVLFLTFFFLKEPSIVKNALLLFIPKEHVSLTNLIISDSRALLSRYFIGILLELTTMMTIIAITLSILGIHNALLIGFLGGLMNVIPYLGPIIGATTGILFGIIYVLSSGLFDELNFTIMAILSTFVIANLIDNFLLQPLIYSKSVKAHPVEIFLVIIMAGKLAGIIGMIAAIPAYTVAKVIIRQFANKRIITKLENDVQISNLNVLSEAETSKNHTS
jgi:predicted PurR-regulated permease PerM